MFFHARRTVGGELPRLLQKKNYRVARILKKNKVYEIEKSGEHFVFKWVTANEWIAHRTVLSKINARFRRLIVPALVDCGRAKLSPGRVADWVILEWQEGRDFSGRWDERDAETAGGRAMPVATHEPVLQLIEDLRSIDAAVFHAGGIPQQTRERLESSLEQQFEWARKARHLDEGGEATARKILEPFLDRVESGALGLSNGDFQFRNFIERPDGMIALVDWDAARLSTFEPEHCVAYQWLLMWNNPAWQRGFLDGARRRFAMCAERFRPVLLLSALKQAFFWRRSDDLMRTQLSYLAQSMHDDYFDKRIWPAAE